MAKETHHYTNEEVTVVWKPKICIHSTACWKGLIEVFNPREKPWVKMDGATTEKIIEQVKKCPSGALSYFLNTEKQAESATEATDSPLKVTVAENGPYLIQSACLLVHSNGTAETKTGTVALCRCGASANKPFCDGSHAVVGFKG